ncbi:hypothetical protein [Lactococcus lactis]|uniref:Foldase protein PrsA n=2 Tax=Lactococcus lactis TaxID=1358 RepID=A0A2R7Y0N4_LACLL|nr:hypothetical protein [Lactococcus lactis]PUA16180.1 Foldase protein PrsA [Lactococcus lactis subsp. lactis]
MIMEIFDTVYAGKASFEKANALSKVTFNSTSTTVPTAAFKLKNGEFSSVIESTSNLYWNNFLLYY